MSESQVKSNPTNPGVKTPLGNPPVPKANPAPQTSASQTPMAKPTTPVAPKIIPAPAGLQTTSASNAAKPTIELPKKPAAPAPAKPTTQVAQPQKPAVQFHSASIDPAAKKADYFAEQNQKAAAEKTKHKKITKKVLLIGIPVLVLAIIAVVLAIIFLPKQTVTPDDPEMPTISTGSTEEITKLRDYAQSIYDGTAGTVTTGLAAADEMFDDAIAAAEANGGGNLDQVRLSRMLFYVNLGDYQGILDTGNEVNPDNLSTNQRATYYNLLALAYTVQGNSERATEYYDLSYELRQEAGNGVGGGDEEN